ncbi:hypothetical protein R6V09_29060 [Streptomyces sp. W16]|uniref:hypothetical protein n=1 Tax=Streptomyces sp. W16 TaxID=3076631 RepID=UPI00295A5D32|nr:hypothetical protein [Streptomyces sp. W16]MDV9174145.1 hypothetical protein [Streptomyces sp. W16]
MSDWDRFGAERGPSEERGQAAWSVWSTAETQTSLTPPAWVSPPTPVPTPVPAPAAGRRAWWLVLAVALAVVVGAGAGGGVWYLTHDRVTHKQHVEMSAGAAGSGSSYRTAKDPTGYTVAVPKGWTRTQRQGAKAPVVTYDSPDGTRRLQIFRVSENSPAESLDLAENDPGYGFARQPGYQVIDRSSGATWAELTYRYDDQGKGARRVIDHRFEAADGSLYAVRSSGPGSLDPALVRGPLTAAVDSFCPAGTNC